MIYCENRNKKIYLDLNKIKKVSSEILVILKKKNINFNIVFLSNQGIRAINRRYLGIDTATDVISFYNDGHQAVGYGKVKFLGDIAVSSDKAHACAIEYKISFNEELYRYIIHGVLHLLGYLDYKPKDIKIMKDKENDILGKIRKKYL
ncbi:MAG: rRNA maturation RNase YbeY [Candidatus Omnitrophica bacterium]|nr:rRNA maturation RNase YbeY [Candidatus Omnitrophota bacterium]